MDTLQRGIRFLLYVPVLGGAVIVRKLEAGGL